MIQRKLAIAGSLAVVVGLLYAYEARAGYKYSGGTVLINTSSRYFTGIVSAARSSADTTQYIACYASAYSNSTVYGSCYATNAIGTNASCVTTNVVLVDQIRAINGDTYINVNYDASGNCTMIQVTMASHYAPKTP